MRTVDKSLFLQDTPLLDVRAPVEFAHGAFPTAVNLPILNDHERELVGTCYKQEGPAAAVQLGHQLVSGDTRRNRVAAWSAFITSHPGACLYCFRGGQRSGIAEAWLRDAGILIPRIAGGYKAMRNFLLGEFEHLPGLVVIAGKTGTGKTEFLANLETLVSGSTVDLEAAAHHRGSAFGKRLAPQPSQIDFENRVAISLLRRKGPRLFIEDESRTIGRINLPLPLQAAMKAAPVWLLEDSMAHRVARIYREYLVDQRADYISRYQDSKEAGKAHAEDFINAIDAIQKRLGGERHRLIRAELIEAFSSENLSLAQHAGWIEKLLTLYYDPMYDYQLSRKAERIHATGTAGELLQAAQQALDT
ncbi:MAG: tRNA 2-selenouridine(34) synthase MnmH [Pseudomonadota bacterium]